MEEEECEGFVGRSTAMPKSRACFTASSMLKLPSCVGQKKRYRIFVIGVSVKEGTVAEKRCFGIKTNLDHVHEQNALRIALLPDLFDMKGA